MCTKQFHGGRAVNVGTCAGCGKPQYSPLDADRDTINIPWGMDASFTKASEWVPAIPPHIVSQLADVPICDNCSNSRSAYNAAMLATLLRWRRMVKSEADKQVLTQLWYSYEPV